MSEQEDLGTDKIALRTIQDMEIPVEVNTRVSDKAAKDLYGLVRNCSGVLVNSTRWKEDVNEVVIVTRNYSLMRAVKRTAISDGSKTYTRQLPLSRPTSKLDH